MLKCNDVKTRNYFPLEWTKGIWPWGVLTEIMWFIANNSVCPLNFFPFRGPAILPSPFTRWIRCSSISGQHSDTVIPSVTKLDAKNTSLEMRLAVKSPAVLQGPCLPFSLSSPITHPAACQSQSQPPVHQILNNSVRPLLVLWRWLSSASHLLSATSSLQQ